MPRKPKQQPNANIFPSSGEVFVNHSRYVHTKIKGEQKKIIRGGLIILGVLLLSLYWGYFAQPESSATNSVGSGFYRFIFFLILAIIPLRLLNMREYFKLKHINNINPLMRISGDGLSWWEQPEQSLSWQHIGAFAMRRSKIYALPRMAIFQPEKAHMPLMCIDTALLDVKRGDMLAYLETRLTAEHKNPDRQTLPAKETD